ncbi:RNA polymerase sigma factor [Rhizorhabdus dicambivorans]|uniref:RNA polymerase sigma factor n=1 Tax=Rhizorhabdus dicambivorans TaxID=1850238 RepID=A0A2A4FTL2_9SPHN|nr:RNA polymerase sigma factor [Rhizorhabdus dicambivorans]ATE66474.1 RNA polymerase sigma factor [Rhizorhabdus dicambivorans]PCE41034.1 RNA polymerase sigma factor [Rhizorhabdus dicambivorans]
MSSTGLEAVFLSNRDKLLGFLRAHGAGDEAEDLVQLLWLKIAAAPGGPIAQPLSYLYRAANNLMLDRYRSQQQATRRDKDWTESATTVPGTSDEPSSERRLIAREQLRLAQEALDGLGQRTAAIFRRHRIDGVGQRDIATEFGVSISTVEADLRRAYKAMIELREKFDEV